jgi:Beta-lactamase
MPLLGRYLDFRTLRLVMWSPCLRRKHAQSISQQIGRGNLFDELIRLMVALAMAVVGTAPQPGRSEQSYADQVNSLIESYARSDLFSGSVLVAHDGHPVFRKAFGPANREWDIPNAPDTQFRIGSVPSNLWPQQCYSSLNEGRSSWPTQFHNITRTLPPPGR